MDQKLKDRLYKVSPRFYRLDHPKPTPFAERGGFECSEGWFDPLFHLGFRVNMLLKKHPDVDIYVSQCKQKLGGLRVYLNGPYDHPLYAEIKALVREAENACSKLCEMCGAPGKLQTDDYYWVACETHAKQRRPEITPHTWAVKTVNGGPVGDGEFFECDTCGASGGFAGWHDETEPSHTPFLAGLGSTVPISRDCVEAARQIDEIIASKDWQKRRLYEAQNSGQSMIKAVKECYGVEMKMGKRGVLYGGWPDKDGRALEMQPKEFRSSLGWVFTFHDGTTEEHTYYNPAEDRLHAFYGPLVLDPVTRALRERLGPAWTVQTVNGQTHGAIVEKGAEPWQDRYTRAFSVKKPGRYTLKFFNYPEKDEEWFADSVEEVCNIVASRRLT